MLTPPPTPEYSLLSPMSPYNAFDFVRCSLQMSPFQTNDYSAGNVLMDPCWTTMSQEEGTRRETKRVVWIIN